METFTSRIWIWLSVACAALWLVISGDGILGGKDPLAGKINLAAVSILVAGVIIGLGIGLQRLTEFVSDYRGGLAR